jgi:hypothetical protein
LIDQGWRSPRRAFGFQGLRDNVIIGFGFAWRFPNNTAAAARAGPDRAEGTNAMLNRILISAGRMYLADSEGYLMPIQKDEPPPDQKYFQKYFPRSKP